MNPILPFLPGRQQLLSTILHQSDKPIKVESPTIRKVEIGLQTTQNNIRINFPNLGFLARSISTVGAVDTSERTLGTESFLVIILPERLGDINGKIVIIYESLLFLLPYLILRERARYASILRLEIVSFFSGFLMVSLLLTHQSSFHLGVLRTCCFCCPWMYATPSLVFLVGPLLRRHPLIM